MLFEDGILRVCAPCEEEYGPQKGNDDDKSHSYCKRHTIAMLNDIGATDMAAKYAKEPDDRFPPDLAKHPELIDHGREAAWRERRGQLQAKYRQELSTRGISV